MQIEARGADASNSTVSSASASSTSTRFKLSVPVIVGIVAVALILIGFGASSIFAHIVFLLISFPRRVDMEMASTSTGDGSLEPFLRKVRSRAGDRELEFVLDGWKHVQVVQGGSVW